MTLARRVGVGGFPGSGFPSRARFSGLVCHPEEAAVCPGGGCVSVIARTGCSHVSVHAGKSLLAFLLRQHREVAASPQSCSWRKAPDPPLQLSLGWPSRAELCW